MVDFDELRQRFDALTAERIRQALTLQEMATLRLEELAGYFDTRAEKAYEEYRARREKPDLQNRTAQERQAYLNILLRRWQEAEELAHVVTGVVSARQALASQRA